MLGKIEGRRRRGWQDETLGWHHQLNGDEFEQTLGDGEAQGSLACCSPWGHKESDTTERLNDEQQLLWSPSKVNHISDYKKLCMRAKLLQSCLTLFDPMGCSPSGSSIHGILQARILESVAMLSSRASSLPRDQTHISCISCIGRRVLYHWGHLGSPIQPITMAKYTL